jgi:hypothetical protein
MNMNPTCNPFLRIANEYTAHIALGLASAVLAVHCTGYAPHESLAQLWSACRALSILDKDLYSLGSYFGSRAFEYYWDGEGTHELSEHSIPDLQEMASAYLESLSGVAS